MVISNNQIAKVVCCACQEFIGGHSKRGLARCLFRVQSTVIGAQMEGRFETEDKNEQKINARH